MAHHRAVKNFTDWKAGIRKKKHKRALRRKQGKKSAKQGTRKTSNAKNSGQK